MQDIAGGSTILPMLSKGLVIELPDFGAENAMLNAYYMWQVVEIVIRGFPTILEIHFMSMFMSLGRIMLQGSVSMNLFDPIRHEVDLLKVEVGILLLGNIYLVADIIQPGIHFMPPLGLCPSFSMCFLIYLSFLHEFCSQVIGFGLRIFAGSAE